MFILASRLTNLPILSLQSGQLVSTLGRPIIDPGQLQVEAFYCGQEATWLDKLLSLGIREQDSRVLLVRDIRQISPDGVLVNSTDDLSDADEVVRLKSLMIDHFELMGNRVETESGSYLGRVEDFAIHDETLLIHKLYVRQALLRNLLLNNLTIDRLQIVDVSKSRIVVRDATIKQPSLNVTPLAPE